MIEVQPITDPLVLKFPPNFLWGAATSAFQVEGNVRNSDWWRWEQTAQPPSFRSGLAADHYKRFREDFDLVKSLGHNAHRLGIEWSRIEPEPGEFDPNEIAHYKEVLKALKDRDMKVMLTLHHFSNPAWIADLGGWENPKASDYFARYVERVVPELDNNVDFWLTINEPFIYTRLAYLSGVFPPQKQSDWLAFGKSYWHMASAHRKAYEVIHRINPDAKVGVPIAIADSKPHTQGSILDRVATGIHSFSLNDSFYKLTGGNHDFLAFDYYFSRNIALQREGLYPKIVEKDYQGEEETDLGWGIYPQGLYNLLIKFKKEGKPILITENGCATRDEGQRTRFLVSHLREIHRAIQQGVEIIGYIHWSLLDNMEPNAGFDPKFGLIEVDFKTQKRTPKSTAFVYKQIIDQNGIPPELLKSNVY